MAEPSSAVTEKFNLRSQSSVNEEGDYQLRKVHPNNYIPVKNISVFFAQLRHSTFFYSEAAILF